MGRVPSGKPGVEAGLKLGPFQRPIIVGIECSEHGLSIPPALRSLRT